jgi:hypothetical protein
MSVNLDDVRKTAWSPHLTPAVRAEILAGVAIAEELRRLNDLLSQVIVEEGPGGPGFVRVEAKVTNHY